MPRPGEGDLPDFRIFETEELLKRLDRLPHREAEWVRRKLEETIYPQLSKDPFLGPNLKKLRGYSPPTWRYRVGRFRVFYMVEDEERVVAILTIDQRRDAYR